MLPSRPLWIACVFVMASTAAASAQPATTPAASSLSVRFHNGSVVQQVTLLEPIEIDTKLGKITVPASEIQRVDFGFRLSEADAKKVDQAVRELGSDNFALRDSAQKTLLAMNKFAYPAIVEQRKKGDLETTRRIDQLIKDIQARVPTDSLYTRKTDIIRTSDSAVTGQILTPEIRVRCEIFGDVKIPLWRLRELRVHTAGSAIMLALDASKYGNRVSWMDTGFNAEPGMRVDISITETINLDPANMVGSPLTRNVTPQGTIGLNSGEGYFPGQVLGRIGEDGPTFVLGSRYSLTPPREGKLYLRVVTLEPANNIRAEGSYKVQITSEPAAP